MRNLETKKEIRRLIQRKRKELEEHVWRKSCESIFNTVISHPWFIETGNIYTYVDYNREAETRKIIDTAFEMGKDVWVPKVTGKIMHFYRIENMNELKPGIHGIPEPADDHPPEDTEDACGLLIMPGVAFDERCRRVGYGGGYYDRYLEDHPKLHRMALAFEFQIFPEVPYEEHDICPEILITERRIICRQDYPKTRCFC